MVLPADSLCIGGFFPVIYSWAFVYHASMFRVVDVLCAVSYTVAEVNGFFSLLWIFFLCVIVFIRSVV